MELIDTHTHLNDEQYLADSAQVIEEALQSQVCQMIVPGTDLETSLSAIALAEKHSSVFAAIGIHPHEAQSYTPSSMAALAQAYHSCLERAADVPNNAKPHPIVAIGEIGLDYHYDFAPRDLQRSVLLENLKLARRLNLPVIIHVREADQDLLKLLTPQSLPAAGGVIHCCSSPWEYVQQYLALGLHIGITGMVTYPKLHEVHHTAEHCPRERLLVETDGPYLAPVPHRGRRNHPKYVAQIAATIAGLRCETLEEVAAFTTANARRLFALPLIKY